MRYYTGTVASSIAHGSKTVWVTCLGNVGRNVCRSSAKLNLADLPQVTWQEVAERFTCSKCGTRGDVDIRFNHDEGNEHLRACNIIDGKIVR